MSGSRTSPSGISGSGTYDINFVYQSGDASHVGPLGILNVRQITAQQQGSAFTIAQSGVLPALTGTFDATTGRFSTSGRGTMANVPNVGVVMEGIVNQAGDLTATCVIGGNRELPGGNSVTLSGAGKKRAGT